ncbi:hypothetical protein FVE85_5124 [Porphyridium purpureum]|uniref:Uncharacterized protein n=1 Tax=Porphyridium purpureum TaxID=35688 RepID=A0A5J4Z0Y1_PORPP|nr:hypothetical protein FVE85_5124 [Porphyridium purpureum]|eukprot:POR0504..scf295_1
MIFKFRDKVFSGKGMHRVRVPMADAMVAHDVHVVDVDLLMLLRQDFFRKHNIKVDHGKNLVQTGEGTYRVQLSENEGHLHFPRKIVKLACNAQPENGEAGFAQLRKLVDEISSKYDVNQLSDKAPLRSALAEAWPDEIWFNLELLLGGSAECHWALDAGDRNHTLLKRNHETLMKDFAMEK